MYVELLLWRDAGRNDVWWSGRERIRGCRSGRRCRVARHGCVKAGKPSFFLSFPGRDTMVQYLGEETTTVWYVNVDRRIVVLYGIYAIDI